MEQLSPTGIAQVFASEGPLAAMDDYVPREGQVAMAKQIGKDLFGTKQRHMLIDAGTGIGKTFAYLVPAILSGAKVIVATNTKALQDQLARRDIPRLEELLEREVKTCTLKGIGNYVCRKRLAETVADYEDDAQSELVTGGRDGAELERVVESVDDHAFDGDTGAIRGVRRFATVWPLVTATSSQCDRRSCEHYQRDCYYFRKLREAREAQLLVLNHALYFAAGDLAKDEYAACVFDEGHHVVEQIHHLLGRSLSLASIDSFFEDLLTRRTLEKGEGWKPEQAWQAKLDELIDALLRQIAAAQKELLQSASRTMGARAALEEMNGLEQTLHDLSTAAGAVLGHVEEDRDRHPALKKIYGVCDEAETVLAAWRAPDDSDVFGWLERTDKNAVLYCAPYDTAAAFQQQVLANHAVALCSATMAWDGRFDSAQQRLGLKGASSLAIPSPFDFQRNGVLHLPKLKTAPTGQQDRQEYVEEIAELGLQLAIASGGGAFMLFAAKRDLDAATRWLRPKLGGSGLTLVNQFDGNPRSLVQEHFHEAGGEGRLLLGLRTFWQGIDVPGRALRLVIIDRIPFIPPSDPIMQARERFAERQDPDGGRTFESLQVYPAAMLLKQAVGRLLRGEDDRGVAVLCDPRLRSKGYGARILAALQPLRREDSLDNTIAFLKEMKTWQATAN